MCAEQRLCVSIASIKRAELGNNILFRTARNIASFFEVDLASIIEGDDATVPPARQTAVSNQISIGTKRELVVLVVDLVLPENMPSFDHRNELRSNCEVLASESDCRLLPVSDTRVAIVFGEQGLMGYEHFQALQFARRLQRRFKQHESDHVYLHCLIGYQIFSPRQIDANQADAELLGGEVVGYGLKQFATTESALILVTGGIEQSLGQGYEILPQNAQPGDLPLWQVGEDEASPAEVVSFIGRDLQRQQFEAAVESVFAYGEMQVIYISGMAGIGKTRLQEELYDHATNLGIQCHRTHVLDFGIEQSQTAIPKLIRSLLKLSADDINLGYAELNERFGSEVCAEKDLLFLYSWLNWPLTGKSLSLFGSMSHDARSTGLHKVVGDLIRKLTREAPLLLCIEDMHWANDDLLDSILLFAEALKESKVILLFTSRKENDPMQNRWASAWIDFPMLVMNLSPLRPAEAERFAENFSDVSDEYKKRCIDRAEGNPLFLEQLLRDRHSDLETLPHSVQTLVSARLEGLPADCQTVARAAAVLGQWFTAPALQFVLNNESADIQPLVDHYFVKPVSDRFQFVHALVQQGIYKTITDEALAAIHLRCAQWFESSDTPLHARHLNRARADNAFDAYLQAIDSKMDRQSFDDANTLVAEAFEIDYLPVDSYSLWCRKADIMTARGSTQQAVDCFRRAIKAAQSPQQKFQPLLGIASSLDTLELYDEALAALAEAEQYLTEEHRERELSKIHYLRGNFYFPRGQVDDCRQEHEKALDFARQAEDADAEARALGGLGDAAYAQGKMVTASGYLKQCLEICTEHGFGKVEAANLFMRATTRIYLNQTEQALQDALDSAELASLVGHKRAEIVSRLTAAWVLISMQALDAATLQAEQGLDIARNIGAHRFEPFLAESLACIRYYSGDSKKALSMISDAWSEVESQGIEEFIGPWVISSYALISNDDEKARRLLQQGSDLLRQGCIGHNYFHFYHNAIESCLLRQDWDHLPQYINAFEAYTLQESTPWSEFYINRGRLVAQAWQSDSTAGLSTGLQGLKRQAEEAGLSQSIELISQAMERLQSGKAAV
ncbi:MAG: AAA family ATPase [Gammaproteobacteria bacterium]|nr:AAA family ATPase [Gammaproteobacteria bacterium]